MNHEPKNVLAFAFSFLGVALILSSIACGGKNNPVYKSMENGVEIIFNRLPSDRNIKPIIFELKQERVIDLSSDEFVNRGLSEPAGFDVDADENIYVWTQSSNQEFIFKVNSSGAFISAFARNGQGPGEVQFVTAVNFDANDELMVVDSRQQKYVFFDRNGNFIRQRPSVQKYLGVIPLKSGKFITANQIADPGKVFISYVFSLSDPDLSIIKEIGRGKYYKPNPDQKFPAINPVSFLAISKERIFFANSEKGYEIACFDHTGKIIRIIRKEFIPVSLSGSNKEALLAKYEKLPPEIKSKVVYPDFLPPFQTAFTDENDRLFVATNEESGIAGFHWHDVFDKAGIFVGRISIGNYGTTGRSRGFLLTMIRNGRLYYFRENSAGFKEIVVCRII